MLDQRGLADARLSVHKQHAAVTGARGRQHPLEHLAFTPAAEQLRSGQPDDSGSSPHLPDSMTELEARVTD
jgi:hypothetical protein